MSLLNTIRIGKSGLKAASTAVEVVGRNVTNAGTDGYHRKDISTVAADPVQKGLLYSGSGVSVDAIRRSGDDLLGRQQAVARGEKSFDDAAWTRLAGVQSAAFDETTGQGVADRLDAFFDSIEALTADPADEGMRIETLYTADTLANAVRSAASTLTTHQVEMDAEVADSISEVNNLLANLANLQARIRSDADMSGQGDLLDQRDQLIGQVNDIIGASVIYNADNTVTLLVGGVAVLSDNEARTLTYSHTATSWSIEVDADSGTIDVSDDIGGEVGGWLTARTQMSSYHTSLNTWTAAFVANMNAAHAGGFDAYGAAGGALFTATAGDEAATLQVDALVAADPLLLAASSTGDIGDSGNLQVMANLQSAGIVAGSTLGGYLATLYTQVGTDVAFYEDSLEASSNTLEDLDELEAAASGVDLDEEASDLLTWQAAYQAASRVIETSNSLLQDLLNTVR